MGKNRNTERNKVKETIALSSHATPGTQKNSIALGNSDLLTIEDRSDEDLEQDRWSTWWQSFLRGSQLPENKKRGRLRAVDLFCGAGGFALGASLAARGFGKRAWFERIVDADGEALEVHNRSLEVGKTVNAGVSSLVDYQIRQRNGEWSFAYPPEIVADEFEIQEGIDLLIGGPPCQGHSNLNNHTRRNDPRNDLLLCTVAIAIALRAKCVVIENVSSIRASHGDIVGIARELFQGAGYLVNEEIVRADRIGWPQTRERYFMTAIRKDAAVHELPAVPERAPRDVMWAIGDLRYEEMGIDPFDTAPIPTEVNRRRINWLFDNNEFNLANSERPSCHRDGTTYTAVYGRMYPNRAAPTITTGIGTPGQGRFIHPMRRRLITPHEAARIQGFPDGYGFSRPNESAKRKDLAKWIGDAVPSALGYEMVRRALLSLGL
ncbi:MAG: DNA cytosine methyltransferase [Halothiobacillaceae bacterium]|nr:DNA cytosine methyltransferase [Halothiobacillaceae bacterium]HER34405.1 DNA cytosine methyltransferase [Halothiobacillaceae bacterium]